MKKHLIAAAVAAAVAVPAMAQNVEIYGVIDLSATSSSKTATAVDKGTTSAGTATTVNSSLLSTNRLGFRGTEDLGKGLKAGFVLETNVAFDSEGARNIGDRGAEIFVNGAFGEVRIGKGATSDANTICSGPTNLTNFTGSSVAAAGTTSRVGCGTAVRPDNRIQYISPSFSGLKVNLAYATNSDDVETNNLAKATEDDGKYTNIGLSYSAGPLTAVAFQARRDIQTAESAASVATSTITNAASCTSALCTADNSAGTGYRFKTVVTAAGDTAAQDGKIKDTGLMARYDFGVLAAQVRYVKTKTSGDVNVEIDTKTTALDVTAPLGNGFAVGAGYMKIKDKERDDNDASKYAVYVTKELSKRTNVYAAYSRSDNDDNQFVAASGAAGTYAGEKQRMFGLGVRHSF